MLPKEQTQRARTQRFWLQVRNKVEGKSQQGAASVIVAEILLPRHITYISLTTRVFFLIQKHSKDAVVHGRQYVNEGAQQRLDKVSSYFRFRVKPAADTRASF